ncbi:glycosyltransferase family 8 protein [Ancylobacter dichloromethanicus]|uniref:General stress protein A n=1 Tax=Ancylobacter dichloromethanicus TaxID=518825 RepID=A0A9W6MYH5_9HYPH|nr:glycosyltransferase family 8 protein [Ancylobacter dichloromethanicus]MBS7553857.1 glycosyltransferase family 8 protein [Ancylobacter dichloromethanicus]GLK70962.1 general stress protein A [Ancylobacter dichloromethanicus]
MIVATATDTAYVELTGVMLASLADKAAGDFTSVHVFCDAVSEQDKARLAAAYGLANIVFVDLTDDMVRHFAARPVNHHLSRTAYARILMPLSLAEATGRLFYIDCDTLVNAPLAPLATLPMQGFALAAVDDIARQVPERHAKRNRDIGLPEAMRYFNSGVLLIDLDAWRRERVSERTIDFINDHPTLPMMDQDALNGALQGAWLPLDERWNLHRRLEKGVYTDDPAIWREARIVHFIGQVKPNYTDCNHPARELFLAYRARTPFASVPLKTRFGRKVEKRGRKLRRFFGKLKRRVFGA